MIDANWIEVGRRLRLGDNEYVLASDLEIARDALEVAKAALNPKDHNYQGWALGAHGIVSDALDSTAPKAGS